MCAAVAAEKRQASDRDRFRGLVMTMTEVDRELDRIKCLLDGVLDTVAAAHEYADGLEARDVNAVDACLVAASGAIGDLREVLKDPAKALLEMEIASGKGKVPEVPQAETPSHDGNGDGDGTAAARSLYWRMDGDVTPMLIKLDAVKQVLSACDQGYSDAGAAVLPACTLVEEVEAALRAVMDKYYHELQER